ncbi:hypothetical protein Bhyg_12094 [Pseudolycoriella hygida]|uniref:Uncharacterized protein n=1 Tax=Pseudolycoriella hygida TaxID=35572 RepID=A0A9Q0MYB1_9DIPT|nr:hypothetical protein Bhyg_12094 [Pseudolycoriella hygida]
MQGNLLNQHRRFLAIFSIRFNLSEIWVPETSVLKESMAMEWMANEGLRSVAKIDSLESAVAESINKVKIEVNAQIANLAADIDLRVNKLETAAQRSCEGTSKGQDNVSQFYDIQHVNESRLNKLERESLRNELIINGVPVVHGESLFDFIGDIVNALQSKITSCDVVASYRLSVRKKSSARAHNDRMAAPIALRLVSDWAKQDLVPKYFKMKNLNTADIGFQTKSRIYINESLTNHNRAVLRRRQLQSAIRSMGSYTFKLPMREKYFEFMASNN